MGNYYWRITEFDGTETDIPPTAVEQVKRRWDNGQAIHTSNASIPANQIKSFRPTDKVEGQQLLLEEASRAFREPLFNTDGSAAARWVKRRVPLQLYNRRYSGIPAYHTLESDGSMVTMGFRVMVEYFNPETMDYCDANEISRLDSIR